MREVLYIPISYKTSAETEILKLLRPSTFASNKQLLSTHDMPHGMTAAEKINTLRYFYSQEIYNPQRAPNTNILRPHRSVISNIQNREAD